MKNEIQILYVDLPKDSRRDSVEYILQAAKATPEYTERCKFLNLSLEGPLDHDIYFTFDFGAEAVTVTFN